MYLEEIVSLRANQPIILFHKANSLHSLHLF